MEDDPGLTAPQLWAGRMRKDAVDSLSYGCTGLLGIHWRTRVLGPNVSALAAAAWDQSFFHKPDATPARPRTPEGPVGGLHAQFPSNPIAGTQDAPLYQSVRYDVRAYNLDVPNGVYTVTLKFCEPFYKEPGKRVFGVKLQGKQVIDRLDLFAKVGQNKALDYEFKDVRVGDGRLAIDFVHQVEFPSIAAIVVEGPAVRKIKCGGAAYKDYRADWPPAAGGAGGPDRYLPTDDFYADWALAHFGPEAAPAAAKIFARIDCHLPRPVDWVTGPGSIRPDGRPWTEASKPYAFVDELAALRGQVHGAGNLERFDYWLNLFRFMRAAAEVNCTWHQFNVALNRVKAEKDPAARKKAAAELALPLRKELVAQTARMIGLQLATITTPGEMGNATNWQQQNLPGLLLQPGEELARLLGEPLPADATPSKDYAGPPRVFVPAVRTGLVAGERLTIPVIFLGPEPKDAAAWWRPLGEGSFAKTPLTHVARGTWTVTLPPEATKADLEYYVQATVQGQPLCYPATAPAQNQTVVVAEGK
jgi:hypothetical protein